jgi:hypothetical protein|tara:strand:+ start:144 stop:551 length:408 start_codon:yes stop_codon:yes gene_type:complete
MENNNTENPFTDEELINADKYDMNRDYRKELIEKYENYEPENYEGEDDWIEDKDKIALIRYCDLIVKKNYPQYPSPMDELMVKKMYYDIIRQMNKQDYLDEKEAEKTLSIFDKEIQRIKDENSLEYALKEKEKEE